MEPVDDGLEGELMWESRVIDDTYRIIEAVRQYALQRADVNPVASEVLQQLGRLDETQWPKIAVDQWKALVEADLLVDPSDMAALALLRQLTGYASSHFSSRSSQAT